MTYFERGVTTWYCEVDEAKLVARGFVGTKGILESLEERPLMLTGQSYYDVVRGLEFGWDSIRDLLHNGGIITKGGVILESGIDSINLDPYFINRVVSESIIAIKKKDELKEMGYEMEWDEFKLQRPLLVLSKNIDSKLAYASGDSEGIALVIADYSLSPKGGRNNIHLMNAFVNFFGNINEQLGINYVVSPATAARQLLLDLAETVGYGETKSDEVIWKFAKL